jgi:hypothetical protein
MCDSPVGETALVPLDDNRWRCPRTELAVVSIPRNPLWRVFGTAFTSPLNPPCRHDAPDLSWSRFDIADHATLYGAAHRRGAYIEALAYARPAAIPVQDIFPDVGADEDPVADEWRRLCHLPRTQVSASWRCARRAAEVLLVDQDHDYYVDLSAAETLGALRRSAHLWAPDSYVTNVSRIDIASLAGADREFTCAAAKWLAEQVLIDGRTPRGAKYLSKHGSDLPCWAVWVPVLPGRSVAETMMKYAWIAQELTIERDDPDLRWAARQLGITVW